MGLIKNILYEVAYKKMLNIFKNQSIFVCYHLVNDNNVAHIDHLYKFKNIIQFEKDLDLLENNYQKINAETLLIEKKIPKNSFLISFDDGLAEIYNQIFPILKRRNLNAIFFINPDFVDNLNLLYKHKISLIIDKLFEIKFTENVLNQVRTILNFTTNTNLIDKIKSIHFSETIKINEIAKVLKIDFQEYLIKHKPYINKTQIQEMIDAGFYFGGHTMSHKLLQQLNFNEQKIEIINSIDWLKLNFGIKYSMFAFPFTDKNISKKLINELFEYDKNILIFGNSGLKKDIDPRIIQRFSLENPKFNSQKLIVTENLYKYFNMFIGKYKIVRK